MNKEKRCSPNNDESYLTSAENAKWREVGDEAE